MLLHESKRVEDVSCCERDLKLMDIIIGQWAEGDNHIVFLTFHTAPLSLQGVAGAWIFFRHMTSYLGE